MSDRAFLGEYEDKSGPLIKEILTEHFGRANVDAELFLVDDSCERIKETLLHCTDIKHHHLVVTTGGTGLTRRDVTPDVTKSILDYNLPQMTMQMFVASHTITPMACLSRAVCGVRNGSLIINLPGSPKAVQENLGALLPALRHALNSLKNDNNPDSKHESEKAEPSLPSPLSSPSCCQGCNTSRSCEVDNLSKYPLISYERALEIVLENTPERPKETTSVPSFEALHFVLATDIHAPENRPTCPTSAMDGYACIAQDGVGDFLLVDVITAGRLPKQPLHSGTVSRITTGAPLPTGANAVVMVEETSCVSSNIIRVERAVCPGDNVRAAGSDLKSGDLVLSAGTLLGPADIALLISCGFAAVEVYNPLCVAVLSTGDELHSVEKKEPLQRGHIYDSNRPMLLAAIKAMHPSATIIDMGIGEDTPEGILSSLRQGIACADIVITSGGVSMGELDLVKPILEKLGTVHIGQVSQKPGKPFTFATCKDTLIFGLPGYPVSSLVCSRLYLEPCLRKFSGLPRSSYLPQVVEVSLSSPFTPDRKRIEFHRCILSWDRENHFFSAQSTGTQKSSSLNSINSANALLMIPPSGQILPKNSLVPAILSFKSLF